MRQREVRQVTECLEGNAGAFEKPFISLGRMKIDATGRACMI
ncbi:hypothetical protein NBRC3257_1680 [Gluconobacter thailandicus NBRC 3257]|uniref:Transposase n=1 Tax=Gluconobacter thailandicus NBRC 3257 TaxID=1381097 RepID=A0ABQ0IWV3_GLUTH|nr:hypothetical protein NBRC3255_1673 [Gluconobacter thailandicus NBRC 3255]GAD26681.1 hypothetical protein NBRC3257_1680 [Gluconobacter thailandicus NBRC 3257]